MRCLDPDPTKRYQTSLELAADLARLDDGASSFRCAAT